VDFPIGKNYALISVLDFALFVSIPGPNRLFKKLWLCKGGHIQVNML
jgi:hypothetical protein